MESTLYMNQGNVYCCGHNFNEKLLIQCQLDCIKNIMVHKIYKKLSINYLKWQFPNAYFSWLLMRHKVWIITSSIFVSFLLQENSSGYTCNWKHFLVYKTMLWATNVWSTDLAFGVWHNHAWTIRGNAWITFFLPGWANKQF